MKNIAVIISQSEEQCQSLIWSGIYEEARKAGVNLVTFPALSGSNIISHYPFIADFINSSSFSSVILFSGAMSEYTNWTVVEKYVDKLIPPVISIAGLLRNAASSVVIDNKQGIIDQITHLVQEHTKERIGFVKGPGTNDEALERFDAYISGLKKNHLEYDSKLIFEGSYSEKSGRRAVEQIIEKNIELDALVCSDDMTAIGAIKAFNAHNIYPPNDIAVTGFDDIPEAKMFSPSLTTVRQPFYEIGRAALNAAVEENPRDVIVKSTQSIPRNSCGCLNSKVVQFRKKLEGLTSVGDDEDSSGLVHTLEPVIKESLRKMKFNRSEMIASYREFLEKAVRKTYHGFLEAVTGGPEKEQAYCSMFSRIIEYNLIFNSTLDIWEHLISFILPTFALKNNHDRIYTINKLQIESRIIIDEAKFSAERYRSYLRKNNREELREMYQNIIAQHSVDDLLDYCINALTTLGARNATIVLFYNYASIPYLNWELPEYSYVKRQLTQGKKAPVSPEGLIINSAEILPSHYHNSPKQIFFLPLYFYGEYFGYIITDVINNMDNNIYEDLRSHISTALHNCYMKERFSALSMQDELTDVSNRNGFMLLAQQLISQSISKGQKLGIFFFDIKDITQINQRFGHDEGDRLIEAAASLLTRTFRNNDIIGRIDGDKFAAAIRLTEPDLAHSLTKRIQNNIQMYNSHSKLPYRLQFKTGIQSFIPNSDTSIEEELSHAVQRSFREEANSPEETS
ncbi:MAG: GGDEF domain-containing protein [Fibrobacterota bacterium]